MNYIKAILSIIFISIPFLCLFEYIFNIIQIPFAVIHRYAVRIVFIYKMYLTCQFYFVMTKYLSDKYDVNPIILLLIGTFFVFLSTSAVDHKDESTDKFVSITTLLSIPILWIIYYFKITILSQPIIWFCNLLYFIYRIPIIGRIITFIASTISGWFLIVLFIGIIGLIIFLLGNLIKKIFIKN